MWRHVDIVWTDVSEERIASIFRVEKSGSEEPTWAGGCSHRRENFKSYNTFKGLEFIFVSNFICLDQIVINYSQLKEPERTFTRPPCY
jgi:hypothetical protein